jgi:hypothetical protein
VGRISFDLEMEHLTDCHIELRDLSAANIRDENGETPHSVNPYLEITFSNDPDRNTTRTPAMRNNAMPIWPELRPLTFKVWFPYE